MREEGTILYFDPFYFKNGDTAKSKYFIVLKEVGNDSLVASLPTSKDHVPSYAEVDHGCVEVPKAYFNAFVFQADKIITECDWSFPRQTFVYGHQLDFFNLSLMEQTYPVENIDYEVIGKLTKDVYEDLLSCLKESSQVKRKFKKLL